MRDLNKYMTEEQYLKKQRKLILFFALGSIVVLVVFFQSFRTILTNTEFANPVKEIVDKDQLDELKQFQQSVNELNNMLQEPNELEETNQNTSSESSSSDKNSQEINNFLDEK
jgi:hypothetical protein